MLTTRLRTAAWRGCSLLSAIAIAAIDYHIADPKSGPRIFADEFGYLANARYLAGRGTISMKGLPFYAGGFSLALAPLSRAFTSQPGRLYEYALVGQAMLAGASVLLIAQLCRWLLGTPKSWSIVAAVTAGLYPSFVANTGFLWAETTLTFALLVAITSAVWLLRGYEEPTVGRFAAYSRAALTGAACGYLVTVHHRTVVAVPLLLLITCWTLVRNQARRTAAILLLVVSIATAGAGQLLNQRLQTALWAGHVRVNLDNVTVALLKPHGLWEAGIKLFGQYWYQLVASAGLVTIGLVGLTLTALGRSTENPFSDRVRLTPRGCGNRSLKFRVAPRRLRRVPRVRDTR